MPSGDAKKGSRMWGPAGGMPGVCLTCGGPARSSRAFYCEEHRPGSTTPLMRPAEPTAPADDAAAGPYDAGEQTPTVPGERTPKGPAKFLGKFWGGDKPEANGNGKSEATPKTDERKPVVSKRRSSTAEFWGGTLVAPASAIIGRAGYVPMARAMQLSSPVAGDIIEEATKGTVVDKLIQPVVRNTEKWNDLFDLLGFWAAVGVAQRNPAMADQALLFGRARLVNLLPRIAANIKKERAKERQATEALVDLMPDIKELFPEAGPDDDLVGLLIQSLFAAPAQPMEAAGVA